MVDAFDHPCWVIQHLEIDVGWNLIEIKNKFCFQILNGMLHAFNRLTQHVAIISYLGMRRIVCKHVAAQATYEQEMLDEMLDKM